MAGNPKTNVERVRAQDEVRDEQAISRRERDVTEAVPPLLQGVLTELGADVVDFPFPGGKALQLEPRCGPLRIKLWVDPEFAEAICEEIMEAAQAARSGIDPASVEDLAKLTKVGR